MTDQEIITIFQSAEGSKRDQVFGDIVHRYRERLYAIIMGFTNDHDETDDLLQETFIKAYQHLHTFRAESSLYTWLCRIAINLSISYTRKRKLRQFFSVDTMEEILPSGIDGPDTTTEKDELRKHIKKAVDQLSEKQKKVFILRYYDELSHAEIAQITGNSEGTIKANFFHAMNKVQAYLEKHYFEKGKPHA